MRELLSYFYKRVGVVKRFIDWIIKKDLSGKPCVSCGEIVFSGCPHSSFIADMFLAHILKGIEMQFMTDFGVIEFSGIRSRVTIFRRVNGDVSEENIGLCENL